MTGRRVRWEARRDDTREIVSAPYYVAAAAYRIAERVAREQGTSVTVERDGRPYRTFGMYGGSWAPDPNLIRDA